MNLPIQIPLCLIVWAFTLMRLKTLRWKDIRNDHWVALQMWLQLLFFSIGFTFLIKDFGDFFDQHTLNNLSKLIVYSAFLTTPFLAVVAFITASSSNANKQVVGWLWLGYVTTIVSMTVVYALFISKSSSIDYYVAKSLPEAIFKFLMYFFALILIIFLSKVYVKHLSLEKSLVVKIRITTSLICTFLSEMYFVVMITIVDGGYFWPVLASEWLINLSYLLLVLAACMVLIPLLSNKLYVKLAMLVISIKSWEAFHDLKYLVERLLVLCPVVALPPSNPFFLMFLLNPELYLYRAIIVILDGKAMLAGFLSESSKSEEPNLWNENLLEEAIQINQLLQAANPSNDFADIVETYRSISKDLFISQKTAGA